MKPELRQELKMTPQLLQSMKILQMDSQELLEYIERSIEENPVLEREDAYDIRGDYEKLRQQASWIDGGFYGSSFTRDDTVMAAQSVMDRDLESLSAFLCDQLDRQRLPKPLLALAKYIAESVDEDGYVAEEDLEGIAELKIPQSLIEQALATVQKLDPAGVGARNLSECLWLQLERQRNVPPYLREIVNTFLPELGKKHYGPICRALGLSLKKVQEAEKRIAALEPHPGRAFQAAEPVTYVRPDLFVVEIDGELQVVLNEFYLPRLSVSDYYARLLKESEEKETRQYLQEKMQQAKWLFNSLERRGGTLRRCADAILEAQRPFFDGKTTALTSMNLTDLGEALALHTSTVSRAIRGKFLQCKQGTYPLRYFFNKAVGEQGTSRQAIKQMLISMVRDEDPKYPLSDQQLCSLLSENGIIVARRTVAKYRIELGIGSSVARKQA